MYRETVKQRPIETDFLKYTVTCPHCKQPVMMAFTKKDLKYMTKALKTKGRSMKGHKLPSRTHEELERLGG